MYCRYCGSLINDNAKFCTNCGKPLSAAQAVAPAQAPDPTPTPSQPVSRPAKASAPANTVRRDGTGKYILKRAIFFGIALVLGIILSIVLMNSSGFFQGPSVPAEMLISRLGVTLLLILVPLILAFAAGILAGLAKKASAKNVVRIISAVLKSLPPFIASLLILYIFAMWLRLIPVGGISSSISYVGPILSLLLPLAGFLMDAAVRNGHRDSFAGGVGAVAAFAADKMPIIIFAEFFAEVSFSIPGLATVSISAIMTRASGLAAVMISYVVIIYILKFAFDLVAALCAKGDPQPRVFAVQGETRSSNILLIIGLICAGIMLLLAVVLPFMSGHSLGEMNPDNRFLAPGVGGHVLGTDQFGRDFFTQMAYSLRNTVIVALVNTVVGIFFGTMFGLLTGFLKGVASDVFKGIAYVFGHGTFFALILFILTKDFTVSPFFIIGLFGWGSVAAAISGAINAKKSSPGAKTSFMIPVLSQVVQLFCSSVILGAGLSILGLGNSNPAFPTLGYLIGIGKVIFIDRPHLVLLPALLMFLLLFGFWLLKSGLASKERHNY